MVSLQPPPRFSFLFDFDSTIVGVESLDTLIGMSLGEQCGPDEAAAMMEEISAITDAGMEGRFALRDSIAWRLRRGHVHRRHLETIAPVLIQAVTPGIEETIALMRQNGCPVFIVSGALRDCVLPVARILLISDASVHANTAVFDAEGYLAGIAEHPLGESDGKAVCIRLLREADRLPGTVVMIGDGMSDLLPYRMGAADLFIGAGFHRERAAVRNGAPHYCSTVPALHSLITSLLSP